MILISVVASFPSPGKFQQGKGITSRQRCLALPGPHQTDPSWTRPLPPPGPLPPGQTFALPYCSRETPFSIRVGPFCFWSLLQWLFFSHSFSCFPAFLSLSHPPSHGLRCSHRAPLRGLHPGSAGERRRHAWLERACRQGPADLRVLLVLLHLVLEEFRPVLEDLLRVRRRL